MPTKKQLPVSVGIEQVAEVAVEETIRGRITDGTIAAYRCGRRPIRIRLDECEAALRRIPSARWSG